MLVVCLYALVFSDQLIVRKTIYLFIRVHALSPNKKYK